MCGIAGLIDPDLSPAQGAFAIRAMTATLAHRGPDGEGIWSGDSVHLGHRRLAVIDLSAAAAQPMIGPSGGVLVFNGEIYNHQELRRRLESLGHRFHSRSDSEVLLAAWEEWGEDCLDHLIGMFAFAVWDAKTGTVFLARDRLGKKPLYYHHDGRRLVFASEAKGLLAIEAVRRGAAIDLRAVSDFLSLGYILSPKTIFANIARLPAGHCARFDAASGSFRLREYWSLAPHVRAERIAYDAKAKETFRALLDDAVRLRLEADVPLGTFLSGGLDSSAVAALVAGMGVAPHAFTVGFDDPSYDERAHAARVAGHLGIPLETMVLAPETDIDLARMVWHCDEPFADTSLPATFRLNRQARERVAVALSGDGADEILAGYPTYRADALLPLLKAIPGVAQDALGRAAGRWLRPSYRKGSADYRIRQFLAGGRLSPERAHYWWRVVFPDADKARLLTADALSALGGYDPFDTFASHFAQVAGASFLDQSLYVDVKTWLADDILIKADRSSMAFGLELRSPFLDHRLVEFTARLAPEAKMAGRRQKVALRDLMAGHLPKATLRRRKEGFGAPTRKVGRCEPGCMDFASIFRQDFRLDGLAEDITYKSFALAVLGQWLELYAGLSRTGVWNRNST